MSTSPLPSALRDALTLTRWLRRLWWLLACGVVIGVTLAVAGYHHSEYFDAQVYLGGARAVLRGESPYQGAYLAPLWAAFFLLPFAAMPDDLAFVTWYWVNLATWLLVGVVLLRTLQPSLKWPQTLITAGMLTIFPPVVLATHGQTDFLLAVGLAAFLALMNDDSHASDGRAWLAGMSLALLMVKPHLALAPLTLILLWAARRRAWPVTMGFGLGVGTLTAVAFAVQPSWLDDWAGVIINPPQSIVQRWPEFAPTVRHYFGLFMPGAEAETLSVLVAFGVSAAALWWLLRETPVPPPTQVVALGTAGLFLVTPYAQSYDLSLLVFPLAILSAPWLRTSARRKWLPLGGLLAVYLLPVASGLRGWPYPVLIIAPTLCLLVWLASRKHLATPLVPLSEHEEPKVLPRTGSA